MAHGAVKVCGKRHILEAAVAEIAIEDIPAARQAPGPAKDSKALPQTGGIFARGGGMCKVEVRIVRSEEHTSELQSRLHLVCRLLLETKTNIRWERSSFRKRGGSPPCFPWRSSRRCAV